MAWQAEEAARCGGCGHPLDETVAANPEESRRLKQSWQVHPVRCTACEAKEIEQRDWDDQAGMLWFVTKD